MMTPRPALSSGDASLSKTAFTIVPLLTDLLSVFQPVEVLVSPGAEGVPEGVPLALAEVNIDGSLENLSARNLLFGSNCVEFGQLVVSKVDDRSHSVIIS